MCGAYIGLLSGVARGGDGGGPPPAAKLRLCLKIWEEKIILRGENFRKEKSRRSAKNRVASKKRSSKKFLGYGQMFRGAAKSRSAPGGGHPSYATGATLYVKCIYYSI